MVNTKMKNYKHGQKKAKNKKLIVAGLVLLIVILGLSANWYRSRNSSQPGTDIDPPGTEKIDLSPPTEADKQAVDENKERIARQEDSSSQAPTSGIAVTPTIVDASYYSQEQVFELSAFVSGVFESTGVCKVTLTKGSTVITRESAGFKNSSYTSCTPISIPRANFPSSGEWSVLVSYTSPTAQGSSQIKTVMIE